MSSNLYSKRVIAITNSPGIQNGNGTEILYTNSCTGIALLQESEFTRSPGSAADFMP